MRPTIADATRAIALLESLPPWVTWRQRGGADIDLEAFHKAIDFEPSPAMPYARQCNWCTCRLKGRQSRWCEDDRAKLWRLRGWNGICGVIIDRDLGMCWHCGEAGHEVDHRIPVRAGGTDHPSNLRLLCHQCHILAGHEQRRVHVTRWRDGRKYYACAVR